MTQRTYSRFVEVDEWVSVAGNTNFCSFSNIFSAGILQFENTFKVHRITYNYGNLKHIFWKFLTLQAAELLALKNHEMKWL